MVKIELERINTQEGIMVEALLNSGATGLVMSSEFAKKQGFKLNKLERPMQVRNVDGSFNRERPIENTVEVNIYYKGHTERMEIDVIGGQKWSVILGMPWLARHNPECYDSMLKGLSKELTLVLSDTRELDRVPKTK